jgi:hypothetical protein
VTRDLKYLNLFEMNVAKMKPFKSYYAKNKWESLGCSVSFGKLSWIFNSTVIAEFKFYIVCTPFSRSQVHTPGHVNGTTRRNLKNWLRGVEIQDQFE